MNAENTFLLPVDSEVPVNEAYIVRADTGKDPLQWLKNGVWVYFILLIIEGALRKWVLPGLASPLLIIRDPVALWLLIKAWQLDLLPKNRYLIGIYIIVLIAMITALTVGHGNISVALYGARILLLHFPLIFVIGEIFDKDDVIKLGKVTVWITIPMALLIALQFYSPQSAWVNRGVGGNMDGGGFDGAMGFFRPPATFSFTNGTALFFGFAGIFIFYFWFNPDKINRIVLIAATIGLITAIPLSISRSLTFLLGVTFVFALISIARKPQYLFKMIIGAAMVFMLMFFLNNVPFFKTATEVLSTRFDNASDAEGSVQSTFVDRFLGGMLGAVDNSEQQPFFGYGIGMGTSVGSMLLTGDSGVYLISEGEWGRQIGELGLLLGLSVIFLRIGLTIKLTVLSYQSMAKGELLPWLLLSIGFLGIMQGQWAQPTTLGFHVLLGGLIISALKEPQKRYWVRRVADVDLTGQLS